MTNTYTITLKTDSGSACFPAYESDEGKNYILIDEDAYQTIERFAEQSSIKYPELVSECVLSAINEGGVTCDAWDKEDED